MAPLKEKQIEIFSRKLVVCVPLQFKSQNRHAKNFILFDVSHHLVDFKTSFCPTTPSLGLHVFVGVLCIWIPQRSGLKQFTPGFP